MNINKQYYCNYSVNGHSYKSYINIISSGSESVQYSKEVYRDGKKYMDINKSISKERFINKIENNFYKEVK